MENKGYFGIGIMNPKTEMNVGSLWRSANILGASYIFTIGKRIPKQASDTMRTCNSIPFYITGAKAHSSALLWVGSSPNV